MPSIYWFFDTNAAYNSRKTGHKVQPYVVADRWGDYTRKTVPRIFTRLSDVKQHLNGKAATYDKIGGVVLIRMDLASGNKDYLYCKAEACECGQLLHHAVGIDIWCANNKCPKAQVDGL